MPESTTKPIRSTGLVEPFESAGGPPPSPPPPRTQTPRKGAVLGGILLIALTIAAGWYYIYGNPFESAPALHITPTPTVSADATDLTGSLSTLDATLGSLDTDVAGVDTALGDKQGDLSE